MIWDESDGVGRLTLNRPETLNAWTAQFGGELKQVVEGEAAPLLRCGAQHYRAQ